MDGKESTLLSLWIQKISKEDYWAFFSALILGIFTHLFALTNKLINHDDLISLFSRVSYDHLGRWMQKYLSFWSSTYSMPAVNGLFALVFLSLSVVLVVRILGLKRRWLIILTGASMVTFYTVAGSFGHMYMAEIFFAAMFLALLGVLIADRYPTLWGMAAAGICYVVSLALYQAYLAFAVAICALRILQLLLEKKTEDAELLKRTAVFVGSVLLGLIAYLLATKLVMAITGQELGGYNNLSSMGNVTGSVLLSRIGRSYGKFFEFLFESAAEYTHWLIIPMNGAALLGAAVLMVYFFVADGKKSLFQSIFTPVVILLLPMVFNCIELYGAADVHILMQYGFVGVYLLVLMLTQMFLERGNMPFRFLLHSVVELCCVVLLFFSSLNWGVASNQAYLLQYLAYENCYAIASSIMQSVISHPDYEPGMGIWVKGTFTEGNYPMIYATAMEDTQPSEDDRKIDGYWLLNWYGNFIEFSKYYLGMDIIKPDRELRNQIEASEEFKAMPNYPAQGSVCEMEGIMVVKISDVEE